MRKLLPVLLFSLLGCGAREGSLFDPVADAAPASDAQVSGEQTGDELKSDDAQPDTQLADAAASDVASIDTNLDAPTFEFSDAQTESGADIACFGQYCAKSCEHEACCSWPHECPINLPFECVPVAAVGYLCLVACSGPDADAEPFSGPDVSAADYCSVYAYPGFTCQWVGEGSKRRGVCLP